MVHDENPYAAPSVSDHATTASGPSSVSVVRYRWAIGTALACVLGGIPASALAVWDIETIVASGPILLVAAMVLLVLAHPKPLRGLWAPAFSISASVMVIFLWINLTGMGRRRLKSRWAARPWELLSCCRPAGYLSGLLFAPGVPNSRQHPVGNRQPTVLRRDSNHVAQRAMTPD